MRNTFAAGVVKLPERNRGQNDRSPITQHPSVDTLGKAAEKTLRNQAIQNMPWRESIKNQHDARKADNLWRSRRVVESPQGRLVDVDGTTYLNFCSNDYLGLANHPDLSAAAIEATKNRGTGSGASHLVCGHMDQHHRLENEAAEFVGAEKAIVFSTGYMANLAIPQTFLGKDDLLLEDRLNHASLIDAGRYCDASMKRYPHLDVDTLEEKLAKSRAPRKMVFTDGVFSMDGDTAAVSRLQSICQQHDAMLVVDDAHGFGVLGANGTGVLELAGVRPSGNVLMVGTFGKSVGSFGAFVAGDAVYIESLVQFARTYIYTTALPPSVIAATRAAIKIIQTQPQRRKKLAENVQLFRSQVESTGLNLLKSDTPIQPIVLGDSDCALAASGLLKGNGICVSAIRPPTVPVGSARLRITLTAEHTDEDIGKLTSILASSEMQECLAARSSQ